MSVSVRGPVAAVDIGGTKLAAGLVDAAGRVTRLRSVPTPRLDRSALLGAVHDLLAPLNPDAESVAVCTAGPFDGRRHPHPVNIPALQGVDLESVVEQWTGLRGVVLNDAQALALAEGVLGAAQGCRDYVVVTVSTGVGGGVVVDGRLLVGPTGNAGHVGHVVVDPAGPPCPCGRNGCLEALVSGSALERLYGVRAAEASPELRLRSAEVLGSALADLVLHFDLRRVVLAGSVALGWGEPYRNQVAAALRAATRFEHVQGVTVALSSLGVESGLIGAAAHAAATLPH